MQPDKEYLTMVHEVYGSILNALIYLTFSTWVMQYQLFE